MVSLEKIAPPRKRDFGCSGHLGCPLWARAAIALHLMGGGLGPRRGAGGRSTCSSFRLGGAREMQRARLRARVSCSERVLARDPKGRMRINGALGGATRRSKRGSGVGGQEVSKSTA